MCAGVTFRKPKLGIVSVNGSSANNIIWPPYPSPHETGTVFIDTKPGVPADER